MNVGILYPSSKAHPNIAQDFMNGLKTFAVQQQLEQEINFISENIAFGGSEKEVYAKAEKLLMIDAVDVLLAYVDEKVLDFCRPLLYASGKLVIVINPGANYPLNWIPQANIVHLTLQHSFLCWLAGIDAAKNNAKALTATTFYDCGYLHAAAIAKGFVKNGGSIMFNYVNQQAYNETFEIGPLASFLAGDKDTTNLLCLFDALPASLFYKRLNDYEDAGSLHFFVSPMMLEQNALKNVADGFKFSIDGYMPWSASIKNEANDNFINSYQAKNKKDATFFALLGWESGMILKQVLKHFKDNYQDGAAMVEELKKIQLDSPRGELKLDAETQHYLAPVGKCAIKQGSSNIETTRIDNYADEWKSFINEPTTGPVSGWTNTYLCY